MADDTQRRNQEATVGIGRSESQDASLSDERTVAVDISIADSAAVEQVGTHTVGDVLDLDPVGLAGKTRGAGTVEWSGSDFVSRGTPGLVSISLGRLEKSIEAASGGELTVIEQRLIRIPQATLQEVGLQLGVTRERVRQIQSKIERKMRSALGPEVRVIASALEKRVGGIITQFELDRHIEAFLPADENLSTRLFRRVLIDEMGFTLEDGVYLNNRAKKEIGSIHVSIRSLGDDAGLINERQAIAGLPSETWRRSWSWLRKRCGFYSLYGAIALRDSGKARAKAALMSIGRPATREEIGSVCGLEAAKVGAYLSNVPSVLRADKERWGLSEWIDDEYDGIVGEIVQRIEEDGGSTKTERLLTELPMQFDVSPVSVRAYMQTPKFTIHDGWISLASKPSLQLRDLDDVIDGRDQTGAPYWTFDVVARFLEGYSVTGVPPEFAKALGCCPDGRASVRIENLPDCCELSVVWRLASTTGASLGYLSEPLAKLGLGPGHRARVAIKGPGLIQLSHHDESEVASKASDAEAFLERMLKRRRAL